LLLSKLPVADGVSDGGTSLSLWLSDESESEWRGLCGKTSLKKGTTTRHNSRYRDISAVWNGPIIFIVFRNRFAPIANSLAGLVDFLRHSVQNI
jgi:hypothetical protein